MYWLSTVNLVSLASYGLLTLFWLAGGWFLAIAAFHLRRSEQLLVGLGTGWVLFLTLANLFVQLPVLRPFGYWAAAGTVLLMGMAALLVSGSWGQKPAFWRRIPAWQPIAALAALSVLFILVQRGLALYDDYLHVPLVSMMAAGDIPPHFYLNSELRFAYHYGLQVWAASLVQMAGFFPWSAWDISKGFAIALTLVLGWTWIRRTASARSAALGSFLISFGGGTRWLLLFLPLPLLGWLARQVNMSNTGLDTARNLVTALASPWIIEGGGAMPFLLPIITAFSPR